MFDQVWVSCLITWRSNSPEPLHLSLEVQRVLEEAKVGLVVARGVARVSERGARRTGRPGEDVVSDGKRPLAHRLPYPRGLLGQGQPQQVHGGHLLGDARADLRLGQLRRQQTRRLAISNGDDMQE